MTEMLIVGAGPAGVAAALMAASVGMRTTLIEAEQVGGNLNAISGLANVPGSWSKGAELAEAMAADIARLQTDGWCTLVHDRVVSIIGSDDRAEVTLAGDRNLTGAAAVVATGVCPLTVDDVGWIDAPVGLAMPLWRAAAHDLAAASRTVVLGGDRPLGTWLRSHPDSAVELEVLYPAGDAYKIAEVADDPRLHVHEVGHVTATPSSDGVRLTAQQADGDVYTLTADVVLENIGSKPAAPRGDLVRGPDGYCPPDTQHPRILIAGDLRSSRFQRIVTSQGSGAETVLAYYYRRCA